MSYVFNANEAAIVARLSKIADYSDSTRAAMAELTAGKLSPEGFVEYQALRHQAAQAAAKAAAPEFEFNEWGCAFPMKGKRFGKLEFSPEQVDKLATLVVLDGDTAGDVVCTAEFEAYVRFVAKHRAAIQAQVDKGRAEYDAKKAQEKLAKLTPAQRKVLAAEAAKQEATAA